MTSTKGSKTSSANTARHNAVKQLIAENGDRYTALLGEQRVALGLPADPLHARKQEQIKKHAAQLQKLGVTVNLDEMLAAIS